MKKPAASNTRRPRPAAASSPDRKITDGRPLRGSAPGLRPEALAAPAGAPMRRRSEVPPDQR
jgi:hypothetical protein